jgi:uncharacterized protein involved in exopolysaccharide biosynthesis
MQAEGSGKENRAKPRKTVTLEGFIALTPSINLYYGLVRYASTADPSTGAHRSRVDLIALDERDMWTGNRSLHRSAAQLRFFMTALLHSRWILVAWILACAVAGLAYAMSMKAEFIAKVNVLIEPQQIVTSGPRGERRYSPLGWSDREDVTELRALCSAGVLRSAFDEMRQAGTPENFEEGHAISFMLARLGLSSKSTPMDEKSPVFDSFAHRARCLRLGNSNVIELNYRAQDPNVAAQAANAIAAAYVRKRLADAQAAVERAGGAYRETQTAELLAEITRTRAAGSGRVAPDEDLYFAGARILGAAVPPPERSWPRTTPIVVFAMGFGAISGVMVTLLRARYWARKSLVQVPSWAILASHTPLPPEDQGPSGVR